MMFFFLLPACSALGDDAGPPTAVDGGIDAVFNAACPGWPPGVTACPEPCRDYQAVAQDDGLPGPCVLAGSTLACDFDHIVVTPAGPGCCVEGQTEVMFVGCAP